jgi:integrase
MAACKFTRAFVARVVAGKEGPGTWTDTESPLGLKHTPAGATSYRVVLKVNGIAKTFTPRDSAGKALRNSAAVLTLDQARAWAKELVARLTLGDTAGPPVPKKQARVPSFADTAKTYLSQYQAHRDEHGHAHTPKAVKSEGYAVGLAAKVLGDYPVSDIGPAELDGLKATGSALTSPAQRRLAWGAAKRVMDVAVTAGHLPLNPAAAMRAPKPARARGRVLTMAEVRAIWRACETTQGVGALILRFGLAMPLRRGEIAGLSWSSVDLDAAELSIIPEKKTTPHRLPLTRHAVELLAAIKPEDPGLDDLVFPSGSPQNQGGLFSGWSAATARIRKRAGVRDWTPHDFRRTAVTHVVERFGERVSVEAVDAWLTHVQASTSTGVRGVYIRATHQRGMRAVAAAWDQLLDEALAGGDVVVPMRRAAG